MKVSAGILLYRIHRNRGLEVLLVHPGGPYNRHKDRGSWSIPKGEYAGEESPWQAAQREFEEELGTPLLSAAYTALQPVKQKGGKTIVAFACEGDLDDSQVRSNEISIEFPYKSGRFITVPEVDQAAWFDPVTAKAKINPAQAAFIEELEKLLNIAGQ